MSWFSFFKKSKKNKKYIIKDDPELKTHTVSELVKIIKTNKGYTSSPYSQKYIKPDSTTHEYKPIKTTFSNEPVPLAEAKPKEEKVKIVSMPIETKITNVDIDHYETQKLVKKKEVDVVEPKQYKKENRQREKTIIEEKIEVVDHDFVLPKDGKIFVMNGYGVNVKCNEQDIVAYIDTGVDVNIDKGQEVLLHHWGGSYDKKTGIVLSGTDTERSGTAEDILIQNV